MAISYICWYHRFIQRHDAPANRCALWAFLWRVLCNDSVRNKDQIKLYKVFLNLFQAKVHQAFCCMLCNCHIRKRKSNKAIEDREYTGRRCQFAFWPFHNHQISKTIKASYWDSRGVKAECALSILAASFAIWDPWNIQRILVRLEDTKWSKMMNRSVPMLHNIFSNLYEVSTGLTMYERKCFSSSH